MAGICNKKKQRSGYRCFNFVFKKRQFAVSMTISLTGFLLRRRCRTATAIVPATAAAVRIVGVYRYGTGNAHLIQHAVEYLSRCKHDTF